MMDQKGCDEKQARLVLQQNDRDSAGFIRSYFEADWDDKELYDLVINTRTMSMDTSTGLITKAMGAREFSQRTQTSMEKLNANSNFFKSV